MLNNLFKNNKKTQKTREKVTGRSMVEMLGVLAIIGVLSIGGIQGYTIAMRRYKANEIVSSMQKYASLVYFSFQKYVMENSQNVYIAEAWHPENGGFPIYWCYSSSCWQTLSYSDSGLGKPPYNVQISASYIHPPMDPNGSSDMYLNKGFKATNYVDIVVYFSNNDKELCKTVKAMLDMFPDSDATDWCGSNGAELVKLIPIETEDNAPLVPLR